MAKGRRGGERAAHGSEGERASVVAPGKVSLVDQLGVADPVTSAVPGRSARTDRLPVPRRGIARFRDDAPAAKPETSDE